MLLFDGLLGLLMLGVWLFCIIDVITTPNDAVRNLPKLAWLFIVILLSDIGSIAWLVAGRDWSGSPRNLAYQGNRTPRPRAGAAPTAARRPMSPDDDEEFLAGLRARAEEQRRTSRNKDEDGTTTG